ncbi:MAG: transposase [Stenotrophomonas sp.]
MRKRFYEAQVIDFLLDIETPATLQELCRKHGFSEASYALLRRACGGTRAAHLRQLRCLEKENRRLKALLEAQLMERERIKQALLQPF